MSAAGSSAEEKTPHWIEWVTGTISAALVLLMIGLISWEVFTQEEAAPDLSVSVTSHSAVENGHRVTFDIANKSTTTAADVTVRGEIISGDVVEETEVTFDYVAAESRSSGALLFSSDPGAHELRIRVLGYTDP